MILTDDEQLLFNGLPDRSSSKFPERHGQEWTEDEAILVISLRAGGYSHRAIAKKIKRTEGAITSFFHKPGRSS